MRQQHLLLVLAVALPAVAPAVADAQLVDDWDETFAGVRHLHRHGTDDAGATQSYHVVLVDLTHPDVSVGVAQNHDTWRGAKETVRGMADRHGAAVAVNGDYWSWGTNDPPQGTMAIDGTCYRAHPERSAVAFDDSASRVEIGRMGTWPIPDGPPDDCAGWVDDAVSAGPQFLFGGEARWEETANASDSSHVDINGDTFFGPEAWGWDTVRAPNTAVGISAEGETLVLVTCDGRGAGGADGCRMASDMVDIMREHGAHDALKLDSGGSTTFYYDGDVRNVPSDGSERRVVNALMIFSPRVGTGACDVVLDDGEVVIDDSSPCFRRSGSYWWSEATGTGGSTWWTWAFEGDARDSWARWEFGVAAPGRWRVEAFVPDFGPLTAQAPYAVQAAGGDVRVVADQQAARGGWLPLGEHDLAASSVSHVRLEDHTGEPFHGADDDRSRRIAFDALRFTPLPGRVDGGAGTTDGGPGDLDGGPGPADDGGRPAGSDGGSAGVDGGGSDPGSGPGSGAAGGCSCRAAAAPVDGGGSAALVAVALGALRRVSRRRPWGRARRSAGSGG